jgi:tRNA-specific 2-thiouridylase
MGERIAVAMSGGVDSSVAAILLKEQGHELVGVTLKLVDRVDDCQGLSRDAADARAVAMLLGFPHHVLDFRQEFCARVMDPFVRAYEAGLTPNPCVNCNRSLKFGALLEQAQALGQNALATGHYARVEYHALSGRWLLKRAVHPEKDQSYVLYSLSQQQLARTRFPLGALAKDEIRAIAREQNLVTARKQDSQDICFIPDGDYARFIRRHTGRAYPAGAFVDEAGAVLGTHEGIIAYTVGQRRGLGVSSNHGRLYVKQIRPQDNSVVLSENESLFSRALTANGLNLIACARLDAPMRLRGKVRYRQSAQPCVVEQTGEDSIRVTFDQPQRAVAPGQAVVLYDDEVVVGGATILKGEP